MSTLLSIDTAHDKASISLSRNDSILKTVFSAAQKDQASWLHPAIAQMLADHGIAPDELDAIAVSIGPGSYTGTRIGLATAKGFCFALDIPLVVVSSLAIQAFAVLPETQAGERICPMIDARRMEVFTAVYDNQLEERIPPFALVADGDTVKILLREEPLLLSGNGSQKVEELFKNHPARFSGTLGNASHLAHLAYKRFQQNEFADLAYTAPLYLKEFYTQSQRNQ